MVSRSYSNLLELASGEAPSFGRMNRRLPRVMTVAGIISDLDDDEDDDARSDPSSSAPRDRTIVVANQLPVHARRGADGKGWAFAWDDDSLLVQLKDGAPGEDMEFVYVGCLREEVPVGEQEEVAQALLERFRCVPAFLPSDLFSRYYHGFCKQQLWPLFHYMLPLSPDPSGAIRVNPCNVDAMAEAMDAAPEMVEPEKQLRHEKHYRYVSTHDVGYWACSFLQDLERTCQDHARRRCWGIGFGLGFRIVGCMISKQMHLSKTQLDPCYRPSLVKKDNNGSPVLPFAASDLVVAPTQWSSHVVGKISSWIDLDSENEELRRDSEITLKQEIAWASHLSLQLVPILRAGLALVEHASSVLPATKTYHLGKE